jgi:hypothetical protein
MEAMDDSATIIQLIESLGHEFGEFRAQVVARFNGVDERLGHPVVST